MSYFAIAALSNSGMSGLNPDQGGSPKRFKSISKNPDKYSLALDRGSLLHLAILEPDKFVVQDADRPTGMMGDFVEMLVRLETHYCAAHGNYDEDTFEGMVMSAKKAAGYKTSMDVVFKNFRKPEVQEYYNYLKRCGPDKLSVTAETRAILDNCIENLHNHPIANDLLFVESALISTWNEQEIYFTVPVIIPDEEGNSIVVDVPCKIKVDRLRFNEANNRWQNVDLKTTSGGIGQFGKSYEQYRYYRQNAFYDLGIRHFADQLGLPCAGISHLNVVVETTGLNEVGVFKSTPEWLSKGQAEYQGVLKRYAWHQHKGLWEFPKEYYLTGGLLPLPGI